MALENQTDCRRIWAGLLLAVVFLAGLPAVGATEYIWNGGAVEARADGKTMWSTRLEMPDLSKAKPPPVVAVGDHVFCGSASRLFVLRASDGVVVRMKPVAGEVKTMTPAGTGVDATITDGNQRHPWTQTAHVEADHDDAQWMLTYNLLHFHQGRRIAEFPLSQALKNKTGAKRANFSTEPGKRGHPDMQPFLESAIADLETMARQDPTNRWLPFLRAQYLSDLGRKEEAQAAFTALLTETTDHDYQMLRMTFDLEPYQPDQVQPMFDRALKQMVAHGYEPEQCSGLISAIILYGAPAEDDILDPVKDIAKLNARGERIWALAPYCEMVHVYYTNLAAANRLAGNADLASLWQQRAQEAAKQDAPFYPGDGVVRTGHAITLLGALLLALPLMLIIQFLRDLGRMAGARGAPGWQRWNPFSYWSKGAIVGALALLVVLTWANTLMVKGVQAIAIGASQPLATISGFGGHPAGVEFWSRHKQTPAGQFCYAVALQQSGNLDGAAAEYTQLNTAQALNNLGVIRDAQGQAEEAKGLYAQALAKDPNLSEAAFNAGQAANSARVQLQAVYGRNGKLLALPTPEQIAYSFEHSANSAAVYLPGLTTVDIQTEDGTSSSALGILLFLVVLTLALAAVAALFSPRVQLPADFAQHGSSRLGWLGWGLTWLTPGTSRAWWMAGPAVLTAFLFSFYISSQQTPGEGYSATNPVEMLAMPNVSRAYGGVNLPAGTAADGGQVATDLPELTQFVYGTRNWWWVILLANVVLLAVVEKLRPDPAGPFTRAGFEMQTPPVAGGAGETGGTEPPSGTGN